VNKSAPAPKLQVERRDSAIDEISADRLLEQFLAYRNSEFTRRNYSLHLPLVLGDPIAFLDLAVVVVFTVVTVLVSGKSNEPKAVPMTSMMSATPTNVRRVEFFIIPTFILPSFRDFCIFGVFWTS
jgi:hypothetical protein